MNIILNLITKYWLSCTLFILTAITVLSLSPLETLPPAPGTDKTHHFIAYGTLILPIALKKPKYWVLIALLYIAWSGAIELIQPYVNRYGEWKDLLANIAGLACGLIIAEVVKRFFVVNSN